MDGLFAALALLVGVLVSVQAGMLARIEDATGSAVFAALASFATGTVALAAFAAARREWPAAPVLAGVPARL